MYINFGTADILVYISRLYLQIWSFHLIFSDLICHVYKKSFKRLLHSQHPPLPHLVHLVILTWSHFHSFPHLCICRTLYIQGWTWYSCTLLICSQICIHSWSDVTLHLAQTSDLQACTQAEEDYPFSPNQTPEDLEGEVLSCLQISRELPYSEPEHNVVWMLPLSEVNCLILVVDVFSQQFQSE